MNINLANLTAAWERGDVGELCTLVTMKAPSLNESCAKCQHVLHSYEGRQGAPVVLTSCQLGRDACLLEGAALLGSITKWDELGVQPMWQHHVSNGKCCTYVCCPYLQLVEDHLLSAARRPLPCGLTPLQSHCSSAGWHMCSPFSLVIAIIVEIEFVSRQFQAVCKNKNNARNETKLGHCSLAALLCCSTVRCGCPCAYVVAASPRCYCCSCYRLGMGIPSVQ